MEKIEQEVLERAEEIIQEAAHELTRELHNTKNNKQHSTQGEATEKQNKLDQRLQTQTLGSNEGECVKECAFSQRISGDHSDSVQVSVQHFTSIEHSESVQGERVIPSSTIAQEHSESIQGEWATPSSTITQAQVHKEQDQKYTRTVLLDEEIAALYKYAHI